MNGYKKIVPKNIRYKILKLMSFIPDKKMVQLQYFIKHKRRLNLSNPQRYTEKIQWYKLFYRNNLMPICVDKYRVREYIKSKGLEDNLVELYQVSDSFSQIDFNELPSKFIIKANNGSGTNLICKDKLSFDIDNARLLFSRFNKQADSNAGREWAYGKVEPKLIVEQLLEDPSSIDGSVNDYKFLCFNGKPEYVVLDVDRFTNHKRNIYDTQWNDLHIASDCPCSDQKYSKPDTLDEMLRIAKMLSEDFPAVRVDLYSVEGKVYFGELTFFPWSGYVQFSPDSFDYEMGRKFILPKKQH